MTDESTTTESSGVPPEAFERVKNEAAEAKAIAAKATEELAHQVLVDKIRVHLKGKEGGPVIADPYESAVFIAKQIGAGVEDPAVATDAWLDSVSGLLQQSDVTVAPPMAASGPNPGAEGIDVESGPFKVNSPEWDSFVAENGMKAAVRAVADGRFFHSPEVQAAQETAQLI